MRIGIDHLKSAGGSHRSSLFALRGINGCNTIGQVLCTAENGPTECHVTSRSTFELRHFGVPNFIRIFFSFGSFCICANIHHSLSLSHSYTVILRRQSFWLRWCRSYHYNFRRNNRISSSRELVNFAYVRHLPTRQPLATTVIIIIHSACVL